LQLSDRIAVMYRGKIVATVPSEEATKEYIGLLMAGISPDQARKQQGILPDEPSHSAPLSEGGD
jgi:general nucleoside transport system ATP-binding protein